MKNKNKRKTSDEGQAKPGQISLDFQIPSQLNFYSCFEQWKSNQNAIQA